jgi:hypothetical protein
MNRRLAAGAVRAGTLLATTILIVATDSALLAQGPLPRPRSWADCALFDGVVTPTTLPVKGAFDELYMNPAGFKNGVNLISESKPGDPDYNGGRWHLNVLKSGIDPAKYATACAVEALDPRDFDSTDKYFVCPLLPVPEGK